MARAPLDYTNRGPTASIARGYEVSQPTAGLYRYRLTSGGIYGVVRIWNGPPRDPVTGEEMDRSWRWQATFNGEEIDIDRVWPACGREPIDAREAARLTTQALWARTNAPSTAYADARKKLDRLSPDAPLLF